LSLTLALSDVTMSFVELLTKEKAALS